MIRSVLSMSALAAVLVIQAASVTVAQEREKEDKQESDKQEEPTKKDEPAEKEEEEKPARPKIHERVVVSASATGQTVRDAPAAVTVIDGKTLEVAPADSLADQLRRVPGINVVQFSARDINIASRSASGGINNSTLAISDGRTLYQDFLGFVMWEFAPTDPALIDRVEVVRGPASALWGANAVGGLVHVVTKSPRDTLGGQTSLEFGSYNSVRIRARESFLAGPWAVRVSGSFYEADPFDRPVVIQNFLGNSIDPDLGLIEDDVRDAGTLQPRLDVRADWKSDGGGEWILHSGWGQTRGWIATGLGPFDIDPGTGMSYVQARYQKGLFEAQVYVNYFDGDAVNLINAIPFGFTSATTQASVRGRKLLGSRGVLGWGAEATRSTYDLSIAPEGEKRTMGGTFGELDLGLTEKLRLVTGARVDHFEETIGTVFSPRAALRFKPTKNHTLRVAAGRAFRSPSVIETDLLVPAIPVAILDWEQIDQDVVGFPFFAALTEVVCQAQPDNCGAPPGEIPDYIAVTAATGSRNLNEEETRSIEIGYAGRIGPVELAVTAYSTKSTGGIDFPQIAVYGFGPDELPGTADDIILPTDPNGDGIDEAPAVDVCVYVDALPPFNTLCPVQPVTYNQFLSIMLDGQIPSEFQWANGADTEDKGIELGLSGFACKNVEWWLNYSWQDEPKSDGLLMSTRIQTVRDETAADMDLDGDGLIADNRQFVNIPAEHRISVGAQIDQPRWYGGVTFDYVAGTFWQDVLTSDFWGFVPSYSLVGLRGGWRWPARHVELSAQVTNLLDEQVQQHILGDIIGLRATAGVTFNWENGNRQP